MVQIEEGEGRGVCRGGKGREKVEDNNQVGLGM